MNGEEPVPGLLARSDGTAAKLAAALEGSPLGDIASLPLSPAAVSEMLFCAGLWLDGQWMRAGGQAMRQADAGADETVSALFRRAKQWRETQLLSFGDWERCAASERHSRAVAMEFAKEGEEEVVELPGVRSKSLGVTLAPAALIRVPRPAFVRFWEQGKALSDLGVPAKYVSSLDALVGAFEPRWLDASDPQNEAGRLERARLALAWAFALLNVRARDLRRRAEQSWLTSTALDRWEQLSLQLTQDLRVAGWQLAGAADLPWLLSVTVPGSRRPDSAHMTQIKWPVPSTAGSQHCRWVRPPVLPMSKLSGNGVESSAVSAQDPLSLSASTGEFADPIAAPSAWHELVLAVTWKADEAGFVAELGRASAELWAAADELHLRHSETALNGPDASFKQAVVERFWEPLYALAHKAFSLATPDQGGRAWLNEVKQHIRASADLLVLAANQTETTRFRSPGPDDPAGRPAVVDGSSRETVSFGIKQRPGPTARTVPTAAVAPHERSASVQIKRTPADTGVKSIGAESSITITPKPRPRSVAPAAPTAPVTNTAAVAPEPTPAGPEEIEPGSIWHVLVRQLFHDRRRLRPGRALDDEQHRAWFMELAGEIDRQQQQFVIELPDKTFKSRVCEAFFVPMYALAFECYGPSLASRAPNADGTLDDGAAWLNQLHQALGLAQLHAVSPLTTTVEQQAEWFQDPVGNEPSGRPAVYDMESQQLMHCGTRPEPRR